MSSSTSLPTNTSFPSSSSTTLSKARSVLLLGEGNFTFTSALQRCCDSLHVPISTLTSTSYDSYDDLVAKYPGIIKELQSIAKRGKVQICHSVDATRLTATLSSALHSETQPNPSTEAEMISSLPRYDDIIFNFPHLGFEDLQAHRCLVAHVIHSAKEVLEANGTLTIALAESQGINWGIEEIAERLEMKVFAKLPIITTHWPGYEMKRHHVGKSFSTRVQHCLHYVMRRKSEDPVHDLSILELIAHRREVALKATSDELIKVIPQSDSVTSSNSPLYQESSKSTEKPKKKRKVQQLVEGLYKAVENFNGIANITAYECVECHKQFPTEQGVKTHCYGVHVLSKSNVVSDDLQESTQQNSCQNCSRSFPNYEALKQHMIAKHEGEHTYISPVWKSTNTTDARTNQNMETVDLDCLTCAICSWKFNDESSLRTHLQDGIVPISATKTLSSNALCEESTATQFNCANCTKVFRDERAMKQHANYCQLRQNRKEVDGEQITISLCK